MGEDNVAVVVIYIILALASVFVTMVLLFPPEYVRGIVLFQKRKNLIKWQDGYTRRKGNI